jgi:chromosome segregation ATPase
MNFEEKIDAMRMTLELAIHDIEAQRASIEAQRASIEAQRANIDSLREGVRELRDASAHQYETVEVLIKSSGDLLVTAQSHERRISTLEHRV